MWVEITHLFFKSYFCLKKKISQYDNGVIFFQLGFRFFFSKFYLILKLKETIILEKENLTYVDFHLFWISLLSMWD